MKLATLKDGTTHGRLLVVSRDLARAVPAVDIASHLLDAVERWDEVFDRLGALSDQLNAGHLKQEFPLDPRTLHAPLPRTWQWLDASAFHCHGDLLEKVFGMDPPPDKRTVPLMYQGAGDDFLGPMDDMPLPSESDGIDFEGEVAVITGRVPMKTSVADAARHIRLVMLANDCSLRVLAGKDLKTGFGFLQSKPATSFSPVAVTPDELGADGWVDGRVQHELRVSWNDRPFGHPHAGKMGFSFPELIAHAARSRNLSAGTIIGSGTVSNENYREVGSACIAERRGIELLDQGAPQTAYMHFGDRVRIEMQGRDGQSIFGAIEQRVVQAK